MCMCTFILHLLQLSSVANFAKFISPEPVLIFFFTVAVISWVKQHLGEFVTFKDKYDQILSTIAILGLKQSCKNYILEKIF